MSQDLRGDSVLYPYLQKELLEEDVWLYQMLTARLVTSLGIWIHPDTFRSLPIMLPYAVRDESARGRRGGTEMWGAPTSAGYFRDDNSLIKEEVKALPILSPRDSFSGKRIGRAAGWVASHVWQVRQDGEYSSRHPLTNSFIPNLIWLPKDLSRLSDRTGFVQRYLQALAHKIYAHVEVSDPMASILAKSWDQLVAPADIPEQGLPDVASLNFFLPHQGWIESRIDRIASVLEALSCAAEERPVPNGSYSRYREGLMALAPSDTEPLRRWLVSYLEAVHAE